MDFQLTDEQEVLVDRVKKWYRDYNQGITHGEHPQIYCYSGKAGTGKTTVARAIIDELHLENNYVMWVVYGLWLCYTIGRLFCSRRLRYVSVQT